MENSTYGFGIKLTFRLKLTQSIGWHFCSRGTRLHLRLNDTKREHRKCGWKENVLYFFAAYSFWRSIIFEWVKLTFLACQFTTLL